mmetsp:Transcript_110882/g.277550  ORF Transcript_110882/g.277550 Transcript_110882/m.277550 type:complete len:211 (+) Transcript_110882:342-974(+)
MGFPAVMVSVKPPQPQCVTTTATSGNRSTSDCGSQLWTKNLLGNAEGPPPGRRACWASLSDQRTAQPASLSKPEAMPSTWARSSATMVPIETYTMRKPSARTQPSHSSKGPRPVSFTASSAGLGAGGPVRVKLGRGTMGTSSNAWKEFTSTGLPHILGPTEDAIFSNIGPSLSGHPIRKEAESSKSLGNAGFISGATNGKGSGKLMMSGS